MFYVYNKTHIMQVTPLREYKKAISDICNVRATIPTGILSHPHILYPVDISFDEVANETYLHYMVSEDGMTLRDFINFIYSPRKKLRATIFNTLHRIRPIDIMSQLIDTYEFMLANDRMVGQSNVNPDSIWIDRTGSSGEVTIYVMDTLETIIDHKYRIVDHNKQYWSSEYMREYTSILFYNTELTRKPSLTRFDTKPTPISIVYSLGLVLYFIVYHHDPYPDGRIHVEDRPFFHTHLSDRYIKYIHSATEPDRRKRPTLREWKDSLLKPENKCFVM
jgi:hypothetical protein